MARLRGAVESLLAALLLLLLPLRWLLQAVLRGKAPTVWTGRPLITLAVKSRAERLLGARAFSVVTQSYYTTSAFDFQLSSARQPRALRYLAAWFGLAAIFLLARRVHTFFDGGILPAVDRFQFNPRELWLYRIAGIQHMVWSYGADVRTRAQTLALGEPNCCTHCDAPGLHCICDTGKAQRNLERIARSATLMSTMGDMNEYVPQALHDLFFWPLDLAHPKFVEPAIPAGDDGARPLRVVHAPNHPQFKGSRYLEAAVEQLRAEGVPVELVRVERVPNEEALRIYRSADIVFDQCLIGFHGYFALEAMALGKPVMVFIRKPEYLLQPQECPLINVSRDTVADALRAFALDRSGLAAIGRQGRAYVERYYGIGGFARRLARAYEREGIRA